MGACKTCRGERFVIVEFDVYEDGFLRKQLGEAICPDCKGFGTDGRCDNDDEDSGEDHHSDHKKSKLQYIGAF